MKLRHILILFTLSLTVPAGIRAEMTNCGLAISLPLNVACSPRYTQGDVQVTGDVRGTVTDPSGAVIPGVTVTLVSRRLTREATTDASGRYVFRAVPIGSYRLTLRVPGFAMDRRDVQVLIGRTSQIDFQLRSGPLPTPSPSPIPSATRTPSPTPPPPSPSPSNTPTPAPSPTPAGSPTPAPSPTPTTGPTTEDPLEVAVQKLRDRAIAFNPPSEMRQGAAEVISARITFQEIPEEVLIEGLPGRGQPQVERIKVSSVMKVTLIGDKEAFAIQNLNNEEQAVAGKQFAQWEWKVTPLASGNQELVLRASAVISTPNRPEKNVDIPVLHKTIKVRVDPFYASRRFISNNWQWLWTALVVPIAIAVWKLRKRGKKQRAGFR